MAARSNPLAEFFRGLGVLGLGFRMWRVAPGQMWLGLVPALIVGAVYLAAGVALVANLERLARTVTPFADGWDPAWATVLRIVVMVALVAVFLVMWVITFTAVTLLVGDWFYQRIWAAVESHLGDPPAPREAGFWRELGRNLGNLLRTLIPAVFTGILVFALGFVPVVGAVLAFTVGALIGGWLLAVELTGAPFDARGHPLRQRRRALRGRRALALGFGVGVYLLFLIPTGAVFTMPAAVAGATILARRVLDGADPP